MASKKPVKVIPKLVRGQPTRKLEQALNKLEPRVMECYTNGASQSQLVRLVRALYQDTL